MIFYENSGSNLPYSRTFYHNCRIEFSFETACLLQIYFNISEKAQKSTSKGHWNLIRSHNIRKFFNTTLKSAGCDSFHVEFWMGHQLDTSQLPYFLGNPEQEKELYSKYIPYLTIQKEADVSESPEYQRIKQENQILAAETARHVVERSEYQEVNAKLEKANQRIIDVENDYRAQQADKELASTIKQHEIEMAVEKRLVEFKKELLDQSQGRIRKNMKGEPIDFKEE
jgi:hypothetical protein